MSTTVAILCFYQHLYNQLLKIKYAFNHETLMDGGTLMSPITQIFRHLKQGSKLVPSETTNNLGRTSSVSMRQLLGRTSDIFGKD